MTQQLTLGTMRHYLGHRTESGAVVFLGELPNKCLSHEEMGRKRKAGLRWLGDTPHFCGVQKYAAARTTAFRRSI